MTAAAVAGTATTGVTNGAIGDGVTAFRTEVLTAATLRERTIRPPFGAALLHHGAGGGVTHIKRHRAEPSVADDSEREVLSLVSLGTKTGILTFPGQALRRSALSAPFRRIAELAGFGDIRIATL